MTSETNSSGTCRFRRTTRRWLVGASLLCLLGSSAGAQQGEPTHLYEGLKVSSIDLVASPTLNPEAFRSLVVQKSGAPYSTAAIQKTVAALRGTGKFKKIDVEVVPEADGLRVTFILEPVYFIGMIHFPGAMKEFSYSRLLLVVDYPAQEPYEETRAQAGQKTLTRFFAQEGYFTAQVKEQTELDPAHKLANIVYHVTLGRRAKFGEVTISGAPPTETAELKSSLHSFHALLHGATVNAGKPYSPGHLEAATKLLQDVLGRQNHLANHVQMQPPAYDPQTNRAPVHWDVALGSTVVVRVVGARVSRGTLKKLIPVYEESAFDQDLVDEGQRNLVSYFQTKGYFDVKVNPVTTHEQSEISLVYHIDRGARYRVSAVNLVGTRQIQASALWDQVVVQKAHFLSHGDFSNDLVRRSVENLTAYYHNAGYQGVDVQSHVAEKSHTIQVTFRIVEGPLTTVEALHLEGNKTQTLAALAPKGLNLQAGKPFSQARLDKDRNEIIAHYLELGYPNAALRWSVRPVAGNAHRVIVVFDIDEGPQVRISDVLFLGQVHTKTSFLEHNTSVKAGSPLNEDQVLGSESSLYNLGIFDWASVAPRRQITDQQTTDVLVKVNEERRNSLTYGFGFQYTPVGGSLSSGIVALPGLPTLGLPSSFKVLEKNVFSPLGSVDYSRLNILGRAETASFDTFLSLLDQRGDFRYTDPQLGGSKWSSLISLSAERTAQNPLFTARLGTASLQMERVLDKARSQRLQIRYTFQRTTLTNLLIQNFILPEDQNVRSSMVSGTYIRDTRDKPLDAHHGVFQTLDFGISPRFLGSTDSFVRFFGQSAYYRPVKPWLVWANDVRVGLVSAFSGSHVPISERFFSGGADSLRGFPLNGAGPQMEATLCTEANNPATCTANITAPVGGHQLFILNSEGRFPLHMIYKDLGGVLFYDGGNVYSNIGFSHFFSNYTNTVGVGLRYQTPIGPIRIDVGHNLNPVPGLKSTNLFITLGQSF